MSFVRLRKLRRNESIRDLVSQTQLSVNNLIMPYFVIEGKNKKETIKSMPFVFRLSIDNLIDDIKEVRAQGIKAVLLFGVAGKKDKGATTSYSKDGIVQKATEAIKKNIKDLVVITDVCLCGYTLHGHCGILRAKFKGQSSKGEEQNSKLYALGSVLVDNDATLKVLSKIAVSHAQAGADFLAPSAMMDGQVGTIRNALDKNGFAYTGILAYSAKYASSFYGPFRQAMDSAPLFGDRKSYQMDYRNSDEALREVRQDIAEGADMVMVKPALAYLDIIYRVKQNFNIPVCAYNVSGEYAMVKAYCKGLGGSRGQGVEEEKKIILEILTAIKRAGADLIISYHAKEAAKWLKH